VAQARRSQPLTLAARRVHAIAAGSIARCRHDDAVGARAAAPLRHSRRPRVDRAPQSATRWRRIVGGIASRLSPGVMRSKMQHPLCRDLGCAKHDGARTWRVRADDQQGRSRCCPVTHTHALRTVCLQQCGQHRPRPASILTQRQCQISLVAHSIVCQHGTQCATRRSLCSGTPEWRRGAVVEHRIVFYPVGNGDTSQIILDNGRRLLFDFRHLAKCEGDEESEINLAARLKDELRTAGKTAFDVVALTHGDSDHISGSTDFFHLEHAATYQGGDRVKIAELWVPAAMLLEEGTHADRSSEWAIWRQEARCRIRAGNGIRVFSKPDKLKQWFADNNIPFDNRKHLITDAGQIAPGFTLAGDGVEFFCHSPFIKHVDEGDDMRNSCSLIFNVRFVVGTTQVDYLAVGDSDWGILEDIIGITKYHNNLNRLAWDLFNIPHHCSYKALSDSKGETETTPKPLVRELLGLGRQEAYLVSSSHPIEDSKEGREREQPPHVQAKRCYERHGIFLVTMEEPNERHPEPLVFAITDKGIARDNPTKTGPSIITSRPAPRAG